MRVDNGRLLGLRATTIRAWHGGLSKFTKAQTISYLEIERDIIDSAM